MASKALHCISADYHRLRPALWHSSVKPVGCCLIAIAMIARITLWIKDLLKKILGSTLTVKWIAPSPKKKGKQQLPDLKLPHFFLFFFLLFYKRLLILNVTLFFFVEINLNKCSQIHRQLYLPECLELSFKMETSIMPL